MLKKNYCCFRAYPLLLVLCVLLFAATGCKAKSTSLFSKSAEEALSTFEVTPGFKMELIASEPLVGDPVAMTIDEDGIMYVVEMSGMPLNRSGVGEVMLLSDSNHDGRMDKSTVFADSLIMPSGIMRWKKGVIVTDPPNVYYMEDTDRDGKVDIWTIVLRGFDTSNLEGNVNKPHIWPGQLDIPGKLTGHQGWQFGGKFGIALGPDLGTVHAWANADILTNILDPNKSIAPGYDMWIVKLNNGKTIQGIISTETPTAITLVSTQAEVTNVSRDDITTLTALQMSAMPIDFEKKIDKQQMAELLAFLKEVK